MAGQIWKNQVLYGKQYLWNNGVDAESLAHGAGGTEDSDWSLATSGRWRMNGFDASFPADEENICLLFSWTFKF